MLGPCRTIQVAVGPDILDIIEDDIAVVDQAVGGRIEPPDLIEALIATACHLRKLFFVDVLVHILAHRAWQGFHATRVGEELVGSHPIHHIVDGGDGILGGNTNVLVEEV